MESDQVALERSRLDAVIAGLLFMAEMRRSEVSALRWANVADAADSDRVLVTVRRGKTNQEGEVRDVRFVKDSVAHAIRTLQAATSPEPEDRVVPLSPQMVGLRFTAAARAAAAVEARVTAHFGTGGAGSELTSRGASTTDVMLARELEDEPNGHQLQRGGNRRPRSCRTVPLNQWSSHVNRRPDYWTQRRQAPPGAGRVTRPRSLSRPLVTTAVSVAPSRSPSTCLRPCVSIPNATTMQWSRKTLPSMQTTRRSSSPNGRLRNDRRRLADSATNRRDTALLDVPRSVTSAGAGSKVPAYRRVDTPSATAASVCSSSGSVVATHRKLGSDSSPSALCTRSRGTVTWRPPSVT